MIITKRRLDRRKFLRGIGAVVGLPLLDAMVPALTADPAPARRFTAIYLPNGMNMQRWTPVNEGPGFEFSPILKPLEPHRDRLMVISGLSHETAKPIPGEGAGDHARGCATFLSGIHPRKTQGADVQAGISMDQILAVETGKETQLPSLELGVDSTEIVGSCDFDYSCTYVNTISWRTPTTPLPVEISPRAVFERLFGDGGTTDSVARLARIRTDRSLLDSVAEDLSSLQRDLGTRDRSKLTEYLDSVRDVERSIQKAETQGAKELPLMKRPDEGPPTYAEHVRLMYDLQVLAFQADITRVSTFMAGREVSNRSYPEIGVADPHHPLSHHQNDPIRLDKLAKVNQYHASFLAYYLEKLRSVADGDGSLLDHAFIVYGAGLSDSNDHTHDNLPVLLAGGGAGALRGDRHVRYPKGTPMTNLLLTIAGKFGLPLERLGDSSGQVRELSGA